MNPNIRIIKFVILFFRKKVAQKYRNIFGTNLQLIFVCVAYCICMPNQATNRQQGKFIFYFLA